MAHRRGFSWLEVILVKVVLLGTALAMRGVVRDATAGTMARANAAILDTNVDDERPEIPMTGGLPGRALIIGNQPGYFRPVSSMPTHPSKTAIESSHIIRDRKPFCGT